MRLSSHTLDISYGFKIYRGKNLDDDKEGVCVTDRGVQKGKGKIEGSGSSTTPPRAEVSIKLTEIQNTHVKTLPLDISRCTTYNQDIRIDCHITKS